MSRDRFAKWGFLGFFILCALSANSWALELDWQGQFRSESHLIYDYPMDVGNTTVDLNRFEKGGYYIPGGGSKNAFFQMLFMRLRPTVIVNDNISLKSEWWVGDPIYGYFGSGAPYTYDQRQYNSTYSRGSSISAQRLWGEFQSDFGTVQVGRMPLNWGLGVVWNAGDGIYDRYMSTGDAIRLQAKFGSFMIAPAIIKYNMGNSVGGSCPSPDGLGVCQTTGGTSTGGGGASDISLALKYDNPDEQMELGLNFIRRIVGSGQGANSGFFGIQGNSAATPPVNTVQGANFNTWDLYGKKTLGWLTFGGEFPITSGTVGSASYKTFAAALEATAHIKESWELGLKAGHAPGEPDIQSTGFSVDNYKAFYFHPDYKLGLILFNYQFQNFAGPNNTNDPTINGRERSPFDNSIVNANYLAATGAFKTDKWNFHGTFVYAKANETDGSGSYFFNYWDRMFYQKGTGVKPQSNDLGWEMDYGMTFHWDESFRLDGDVGWYFPGDYYKFSNVAGKDNQTSPVFATVFKVGVNF